ncbi:MAG: ABC transporter ATP-binding protein, partial [Cyanobacteria bacterium J06632_22]
NILSGLYEPDGGGIYLEGQQVNIHSPADAIRLGIGMIHQHFMLVPQLTVTENIILGQASGMRLDLKSQAQAVTELGQTYGLEVPAMARVGDLPVGVQQRVEILKVLYRQANILILDEPTAVLAPAEITAFLKVLRQLASRGHTLIFISHKLDEVMAVCDNVTILRRGQVVATVPTADTNRRALAEMMVNRAVDINTRPPSQPTGEVVLTVNHIWALSERQTPALQGLSLQVRAGEILGIAGVDGNGQRELADAIAGLLPLQKGHIQVSERQALAYIPEDRQKQGLVLSFSIARNLILRAFSRLPFCRRWLLRSSVIRERAEQAITAFDIRTTGSQIKAHQLSGGNQQKVILARELAGNPALIIAMQPTRGLDIGATAAVQQSLLAQRARGAAILYISTELDEVMAISDRLGVIYRGKLVDVMDAEGATAETLGLLMAGGSR